LLALGLLAALGPILVVLGSAVTVVGALITVFTTIAPIIMAVGAAILGLSLPLLIIIGVVGILALTIYQNWHAIIDWTSNMMLTIGGLWNKGWQGHERLPHGSIERPQKRRSGSHEFHYGANQRRARRPSTASGAPRAPLAEPFSGAAGAFGGAIGGMIHAFASGGIVTGPTLAMVARRDPKRSFRYRPSQAVPRSRARADLAAVASSSTSPGTPISSQMDLRNIAQGREPGDCARAAGEPKSLHLAYVHTSNPSRHRPHIADQQGPTPGPNK